MLLANNRRWNVEKYELCFSTACTRPQISSIILCMSATNITYCGQQTFSAIFCSIFLHLANFFSPVYFINKFMITMSSYCNKTMKPKFMIHNSKMIHQSLCVGDKSYQVKNICKITRNNVKYYWQRTFFLFTVKQLFLKVQYSITFIIHHIYIDYSIFSMMPAIILQFSKCSFYI